MRITERQPNLRKVNEYLIVLIMLSDIQVARGRAKLGRKILGTARDTCNKDEAVDRDFPMLRRFVDARTSGPKPVTKDQGGTTLLEFDKEEFGFFSRTVLTDD